MKSTEFRKLALAELDALYRLAFHLTHKPDEAADLVQETYLRALNAEASFELREGGMRPWLFRILHNLFYTRLGRDKHAPIQFDDLESKPDSEETAPCWDLTMLNWEEIDDRLKHALDDLAPHYRIVLLLWAVEGLKYREIADVLGVALGTVAPKPASYAGQGASGTEIGRFSPRTWH